MRLQLHVTNVVHVPADERFGLPAGDRVYLRVRRLIGGTLAGIGGELELLIQDPAWLGRFLVGETCYASVTLTPPASQADASR